MPYFLLDATGLALLGFLAAYLAFLARRMNRLRAAIAEAGDVLPALNTAVSRMSDAASGFSRRIQKEMETIDTQVAGARRVSADLAEASRNAGEVVAQLDRQLRQTKRLESARAAAIPRELAEPKGFAERLAQQRAAQPAMQTSPIAFAGRPAVIAAPITEAGERTVRVSML
ncbi:MAG TPA: hypothetical protein VMI52_03380 [Acetobacteraceae bacterium]|nr:hypothetical protein [Acetobacteraceae bacterium]